MCINRFLLLLLAGVQLCCSCNYLKRQQSEAVPGYDLEHPVIVKLRTELDEISGIVFYPKDTSVFAINDENGYLYKVMVGKKIKVKKWKFEKGGDYEDLALVDSVFYGLISNGTITRFKFISKDTVIVDKYKLPLDGRNEFETLYYDGTTGKLIIMCKDCTIDKKGNLTAFAFDMQTRTFADTPHFVVDVKKIAQVLGVDKIKFKPSAAAIHPITSHLYIISATNKLLVIAKPDGTILKVKRLYPGLFKQPEGIAFTPSGDLIVANESAETGAPNMLFFNYQIPGK